MGALILLLLVTTRKLHNDAVDKAQTAELQRAADKASQAESPYRHWAAQPLPPDDPAFLTEAAEFVVTVRSPSPHLLPPPPPPVPDRDLEREALRQEWEDKLADLQLQWEQLQQRVAANQRLVHDYRSREAEIAAEHQDLTTALAKKLDGKTEQEKALLVMQQNQKSVLQKITETQAELDRLREENAAARDKFQLVPYAGSSPTHRRPIVIECQVDRLVFASEEVSLRASDLSGFASDYNPVKAGAVALIQYWESQRNAASSMAARPPEPYILFVIRPGGTISYYVARRMLGPALDAMRVESGYELVLDSQEMVWPVTDPEARVACQSAVDAVLAERDRVLAKQPGGKMALPEELQFADAQGHFVLDEVSRLKNPQKKTFVGGQRLTRVERSRNGFSGFAPQGDLPTGPEGFVGPQLSDLNRSDPPGDRPPQGQRSAGSPSSTRMGTPAPNRPFPTEPPPRATVAEESDLSTPHRDRQPGWKQVESKGAGSRHVASGSEPSRRPSEPLLSQGAGTTSEIVPSTEEQRSSIRGTEYQPGSTASGPRAGGSPQEARQRTADAIAQVIAAQLPPPFEIPSQKTVAAERFIIVTIDADYVYVGTQSKTGFETSDSPEALLREFSEQLINIRKKWGRPPIGFHWQPAIRFRVKPGGNQYYALMLSACEQWEVRSSLEYVFD